ncbi:MAG: tetratricopeptide repeat protein [Spirochaetes bacterium]|nr:tetratricopeptide repeat protein [Spirochaetota bacterium]
MNKNSIPIVLICVLLMSYCGKSRDRDAIDNKIINESIKAAGEANINREIRKLEDSLKDAKDDFERASIHENISLYEVEKGNISGALKSVNAAIKYQPNLAQSHYIKGLAYLRMSRYEESENELLTAIRLDSRLPAAHFELGNLYYKIGKPAQAIAEYNLAVKFDDKHYQAYNNISVVYSMMGRNKDAIESLNKVIELQPDFAKAYKNLGIIYDLRMKDKHKAIENYRTYLRLRPNAPERKVVKIWIAGLEGK